MGDEGGVLSVPTTEREKHLDVEEGFLAKFFFFQVRTWCALLPLATLLRVRPCPRSSVIRAPAPTFA